MLRNSTVTNFSEQPTLLKIHWRKNSLAQTFANTPPSTSEQARRGWLIEFHALTSVDPLGVQTGRSLQVILSKQKKKARAKPSHTRTLHPSCALKSSRAETEQRNQASQPRQLTKNLAVLLSFSRRCDGIPLGARSRRGLLFNGPHSIVYGVLCCQGERKGDEAKLELAKNEVETYFTSNDSPSDADTAPK